MRQYGHFDATARRTDGSRGVYFVLAGALSLQVIPVYAAPADQSLTSASANGSSLLAQATGGLTGGANTRTIPIVPTVTPSSTILPTDVLPLPQIQNRLTFAENLQLRILQRLPARFYFTSSTEISLRYESNPFQFPTKRRFIRELGPSFTQFDQLSPTSQQQVLHSLALPGAEQTIFRVLPNVTGGFTLTPHTRIFANYFMIRDSLSSSTKLNTTINSIAYGVQHDIPLGNRANLQAEVQFRELYQAHQHNLFDFLPGMTLSYVLTPRTVGFVNALMQMRGNEYFQAPTRELDPFYTWGFLHQRGGWSFSASTTFVQNFREHFKDAQIKQDNYAFISDFEVARRVIRQLPGLQAFVRAEPIWNFHSRYRPGLAGMDFRLFYGLRLAVTKPSLTAGLEQLKQQIEEQEGEPSKPSGPGNRPSAYLMPYQITASSPQPIHGFLQASPASDAPIHATLNTDAPTLATIKVMDKSTVDSLSESTVKLQQARTSRNKIVQHLQDSEANAALEFDSDAPTKRTNAASPIIQAAFHKLSLTHADAQSKQQKSREGIITPSTQEKLDFVLVPPASPPAVADMTAESAPATPNKSESNPGASGRNVMFMRM